MLNAQEEKKTTEKILAHIATASRREEARLTIKPLLILPVGLWKSSRSLSLSLPCSCDWRLSHAIERFNIDEKHRVENRVICLSQSQIIYFARRQADREALIELGEERDSRAKPLEFFPSALEIARSSLIIINHHLFRPLVVVVGITLAKNLFSLILSLALCLPLMWRENAQRRT